MPRFRFCVTSSFFLLLACAAIADARVWTDASGQFTTEADLIARDDATVVLQNAEKKIVLVAIEDLSEKDQEYLNSEEVAKQLEDAAMQEWTLKSGLKFRAAAIEYCRREVSVRRHRSKVYVNDKPLDSLPSVYKQMVPKIVSHFEDVTFEKEKDFERWVIKLKGATKTFTCDGVMFELPNGDLYGIPFFLLSVKDRQALEPGWQQWFDAMEDSQEQRDYDLGLQAQSMAREASGEDDVANFARMHLKLQAYDAGLFDLWEVMMVRPDSYPISVVVPARDSRQAAIAAQMKYPNMTPGAVAKVRRRY